MTQPETPVSLLMLSLFGRTTPRSVHLNTSRVSSSVDAFRGVCRQPTRLLNTMFTLKQPVSSPLP